MKRLRFGADGMRFGISAAALIASCSAFAENLYVTPSGAGSRNGLNWENAFGGLGNVTWGSGAGRVGPGDTLWVAGGNYSGGFTPVSGTDGSPVSIKRATSSNPECSNTAGWQSFFDSQVVITSSAQHVIYCYGIDNITIDGQVPNGIKVQGTRGFNDLASNKNSCIVSAGNNHIFKYLELVTPRNGDVDYASLLIWNQYNSVKANVKVLNCTIHGGPQGIFATWTDYITVDHCELFDIGNASSKLGIHPNLFYVDSCSHLVFSNNKYHDFSPEGVYLTPLSAGMDYVYIYNNICWTQKGSLGVGVQADPYPTADRALGSHIYIYNNTFACADFDAIRFQSSRFSTPTVQGAFIRNNIFFGTRTLNLGAATSTTVHENNWFLNADYNFSSDRGAVNGNGLDPFVDSAHQDFRLRDLTGGNSPRNAGADLGAPYNIDPNGTARGLQGGWDIGAYEFQGALDSGGSVDGGSVGAPTATAPSQPINLSPANGVDGVSLTPALSASDYGSSDGAVQSGSRWLVLDGGNGATLWDSGTVGSSTSVVVPVGVLANGRSYQWQVAYQNAGGWSGFSTATRFTTVAVVAPPSVPADIVLDATMATVITSPFSLQSGFLSQVTETTNPAAGGSAQFQFSVPIQGDYVVDADVFATGDANNSFFINIDGDAVVDSMIWDVLPYTSGIETRRVGWRGAGTFEQPQYPSKTWTLASGTHTLFVRGREANCSLGRFYFRKLPQAPRNLRIVQE